MLNLIMFTNCIGSISLRYCDRCIDFQSWKILGFKQLFIKYTFADDTEYVATSQFKLVIDFIFSLIVKDQAFDRTTSKRLIKALVNLVV